MKLRHPYRWLIVGLIALLIGLQTRLWFGQGGRPEVKHLRERVAAQRSENAELRKRNAELEGMLTRTEQLAKSGAATPRIRQAWSSTSPARTPTKTTAWAA